MATKDDLYRIIGAYGLGRTLPAGSTRRAARAAANAIVKSGRIVVPAAARAAPAVGRGALNLARVNPYASAALLGYGAYEAGLLDPIIDPAQEAIEDRVVPLKKTTRKRKSQFNKAVSEGMKIVRKSTSYGKKGTINNSKKAFSAVTKTVSKARRGLKSPTKGVLRKVFSNARKRMLSEISRKKIPGVARGRQFDFLKKGRK